VCCMVIREDKQDVGAIVRRSQTGRSEDEDADQDQQGAAQRRMALEENIG